MNIYSVKQDIQDHMYIHINTCMDTLSYREIERERERERERGEGGEL